MAVCLEARLVQSDLPAADKRTRPSRLVQGQGCAQGRATLCQGSVAHKVAHKHAQGTHKVAHKVTNRHPRTRSRKLSRAQGQVPLPGERNAQGLHKVQAHMVMEQGSGQTAIYIYIYTRGDLSLYSDRVK